MPREEVEVAAALGVGHAAALAADDLDGLAVVERPIHVGHDGPVALEQFACSDMPQVSARPARRGPPPECQDPARLLNALPVNRQGLTSCNVRRAGRLTSCTDILVRMLPTVDDVLRLEAVRRGQPRVVAAATAWQPGPLGPRRRGHRHRAPAARRRARPHHRHRAAGRARAAARLHRRARRGRGERPHDRAGPPVRRRACPPRWSPPPRNTACRSSSSPTSPRSSTSPRRCTPRSSRTSTPSCAPPSSCTRSSPSCRWRAPRPTRSSGQVAALGGHARRAGEPRPTRCSPPTPAAPTRPSCWPAWETRLPRRPARRPHRATTRRPAGWSPRSAPAARTGAGYHRLSGRRPSPRETVLIERAATTLALGRLLDRHAESLERQAHGTIIAGILAHAYSDPQEAAARARALGVPLAGRRLLGVVLRTAATAPARRRAHRARRGGRRGLQGRAASPPWSASWTRAGRTPGSACWPRCPPAPRSRPRSPTSPARVREAPGRRRSWRPGRSSSRSGTSAARSWRPSRSPTWPPAAPATACSTGLPDLRLRGLLHLLRDDARAADLRRARAGPAPGVRRRSAAATSTRILGALPGQRAATRRSPPSWPTCPARPSTSGSAGSNASSTPTWTTWSPARPCTSPSWRSAPSGRERADRRNVAGARARGGRPRPAPSRIRFSP